MRPHHPFVGWMVLFLLATNVSAQPRYGWTLSESSTDPFSNSGTFVPGLFPLRLWYTCSSFSGLSAAEFSVVSVNPANAIVSVTAENGFLNAGTGGDLALAVGGCPAGPELAATILVIWNAPGSFVLEPTSMGNKVAVDCEVVPSAWSIEWIGYSNDGSAPASKAFGNCGQKCEDWYCGPYGGCAVNPLTGWPCNGPEICETCPDPSSEGTILVDRSHGQDFTQGEHLTLAIQKRGWQVEYHDTGAITPSLLEPYDALLILPAEDPGFPNQGIGLSSFAPEEVAAIASFFSSGRGVWIFSEVLQDPTGVNEVSSQFGVTFNSDVVEDPDSTPTYEPTISNVIPHEITQGVGKYKYRAGCSLNVSPPAVVLATADENSFSNGYGDGYPPGTFPPVLAYVENSAGGCGVFQGDIKPVGLGLSVPEAMITNVLDCLEFAGPIALQAETWGSVKARYRR